MGMFDDLTVDDSPKPSGMFADIGVSNQPQKIGVSDKIIQGMRDPVDAGAQLLTKSLPDSWVKKGNEFNNWLADKTGLVGRLPEGGVDQQVRNNDAKYQQSRKLSGESGFDGYRTIGNIFSPATMGMGSALPIVKPLLGKMALGGLYGAYSGALTPVTEGDFSKEKTKQVGFGAALGSALPVVASTISRIISPNASKNTQLDLLKSEGVQPTIGQTLGGRWNALEEKMQSIPILGDAISRTRRMANSDLETAAHNRALNPIGESLPSGLTGRDAVNYTEAALKNKYDTTLSKIGAIPTDNQFVKSVNDLSDMVTNLKMPQAEKDKYFSSLSNLASSVDGNGVITSDMYKTLESALGSDAKKLYGSQNIYEGKIAPAVKQLQANLRDLLQRQAGSNADDLAASNAGWANFKRIQNAAGKIGADNGEFSVAQLQNAVRALDKSKDHAAFASGKALMQNLSDAGKTVLGNKVPNSFTTDRALIAGGGLGAYLVNPTIPASLLAGAAAYTRPVQSVLRGALSSRPDEAKIVSDFINNNYNKVLPLGVQGGLGIYSGKD